MVQTLNLQDETVSSNPTSKRDNNTQSYSESASSLTDTTSTTLEPSNDVLQRLSRQVEYYFSTTNLEKDTYLATLRSLNDGYVPIFIIANFGKVTSLVPFDGYNAVRKAVVEISELLEVVLINTETGKRATADEIKDTSLKTVEAVGPISGEPIQYANRSLPSVAPKPVAVNSTVSTVQNTVVLREVPQDIEETHIRQLFAFETCPEIESIHQDVANCWFVTLQTMSRDEMVDVMFELRTKKFESGEPVMARLKAGVAVNRDSMSNFVYFGNDMTTQTTETTSNRQKNGNGRRNKKKKNNNKSRQGTRNNNANNQNKNATSNKGKNNGSNNRRSNNDGKQQKKSSEQQKREGKSNNRKALSEQSAPPNLGEEQFPSLPSEDPLKIEVEKVPEPGDYAKNPAYSDTSSTATTSTSSSKSPQPPMALGGYAAALLKAAKAKPQATTMTKDTVGQTNKKAIKKTDEKAAKAEAKTTAKPKPIPATETFTPVKVQPPSWGHGSFADILRAES